MRHFFEMKTKSKPLRADKNRRVQIFDDAVISAALEKHLDLAWTKKNQDAIRREVGAGNYARIEEILAFASGHEAWLSANNISAATDTVSAKLSQSYPQLSTSAVFRIVSQAAYGWR